MDDDDDEEGRAWGLRSQTAGQINLLAAIVYVYEAEAAAKLAWFMAVAVAGATG